MKSDLSYIFYNPSKYVVELSSSFRLGERVRQNKTLKKSVNQKYGHSENVKPEHVF